LHPQFQISVNKSPVQFENPNPAHTPWSKHLAARGLCTDAIYFAQICNLFCTEVSPEKAVKTY